jgi:hypothetical protein
LAITAEMVRKALEGAEGGQIIRLRLVECGVEGLDVEFHSIGRDDEGRLVIEASATVEGGAEDDEG